MQCKTFKEWQRCGWNQYWKWWLPHLCQSDVENVENGSNAHSHDDSAEYMSDYGGDGDWIIQSWWRCKWDKSLNIRQWTRASGIFCWWVTKKKTMLTMTLTIVQDKSNFLMIKIFQLHVIEHLYWTWNTGQLKTCVRHKYSNEWNNTMLQSGMVKLELVDIPIDWMAIIVQWAFAFNCDDHNQILS